MVTQKEDHVRRLMRLLDEDDAKRKLKGKQKEGSTSTSSQMMVQKSSQNQLTTIIQEHCKEQLPQLQLQQPNSSSSDEETAPEDTDWSSEISKNTEPEEPTPPQSIMMNQPVDELVVTEVQDKTEEVD